MIRISAHMEPFSRVQNMPAGKRIRLGLVGYLCMLVLPVASGVALAQGASFGPRQDKGLVENDEINEASGIAPSWKNSGVFWTHNDSGDKNRVFAFDSEGKTAGVFLIAGAMARDWEDIAVGPGPGQKESYLYIGEIGDNEAQYDVKRIYRVAEPVIEPGLGTTEITLDGAETIRYRYPDGPRDAETVMIDPLTRDLYIVSKREAQVNVYRAAYPQSTTDTITLEYVITLGFTQATAGDISPNGTEVLIKNYTTSYYWQRSPEETIAEMFARQPETVPYTPEPQGEGICWGLDGSGYYTISEEPQEMPAHLYFYPRLGSAVPIGEDEGTMLRLGPPYPQPASAAVAIPYTIGSGGHVNVAVYNSGGALVRTLVDAPQSPGNYTARLNSAGLASGNYLCRMTQGGEARTRSVVIAR